MTSALRGPLVRAAGLAPVRRLATGRLGWRVASRFVAGEALGDAMRAVARLHAQGVPAMLNHLGEGGNTSEAAEQATDGYVAALRAIRSAPELDCAVSVKPSHLGLDLGPEGCARNLERVLEAAGGEPPTRVMIDMESYPHVEPTLDLYLSLRAAHPHLGVCVQAYLHRTAGDVRRIAAPGAIVRVCKGAYLEPAGVAMASPAEVRRSFARVTATLLGAGSTVHLATHDPRLIFGALRFVRARSISSARYEFQMLYGVRRDLQAELLAQREPLRVYVPYGPDWYPYLVRRVAERPANIWFFVSNALRRGG